MAVSAAFVTPRDVLDRMTLDALASALNLGGGVGVDAVLADTRLSAACSDANDLVLAYVRHRLTVPLETVPGDLRRVAYQIARWFIVGDRRELYGGDAASPERLGYEDALSYLTTIRDGTGPLVPTLDPEDLASEGTTVATVTVSTATSAVFTERTRDAIGGF